jgi:hypothetical protein
MSFFHLRIRTSLCPSLGCEYFVLIWYCPDRDWIRARLKLYRLVNPLDPVSLYISVSSWGRAVQGGIRYIHRDKRSCKQVEISFTVGGQCYWYWPVGAHVYSVTRPHWSLCVTQSPDGHAWLYYRTLKATVQSCVLWRGNFFVLWRVAWPFLGAFAFLRRAYWYLCPFVRMKQFQNNRMDSY